MKLCDGAWLARRLAIPVRASSVVPHQGGPPVKTRARGERHVDNVWMGLFDLDAEPELVL